MGVEKMVIGRIMRRVEMRGKRVKSRNRNKNIKQVSKDIKI